MSASSLAAVGDSHAAVVPAVDTPHQFLEAYPDSAYTTMYVEGGSVHDLELHLQRLSSNVETLAARGRFSELQDGGHSARTVIEAALAQLMPQLPYQSLDTGVMVLVATDVLEVEAGHSQAPANHGVHPAAASLRLAAFMKPSSLSDLHRPVKAVVVGPPRAQPSVKDTNWVTQRKPLARKVPKDAAEGLLQDEQGRLLEGLVTNLCITRMPEPGEAGEKVLETAAAGTVLAGTIRRRVLDLAAAQGYTIVETSPDPRQRHLWREAFLCNALRMIQPVRLIECPQGTAPDSLGEWAAELPTHNGADIQQLRQAVLSAMQRVPLSNIAAGRMAA